MEASTCEKMFQLVGVAFHLLLIFISVLIFVIFYFKRTQNQWRKLGVPGFLSPVDDMVLDWRMNKSLALQRVYQRLSPHPCGGVWYAAKPYLVVRDPQLVQTILIKAFSQFHDRGLVMPEDINPLSANIFNMSGDRWKNIRIKLVHTFSPMKLKSVYIMLEECIKVLDRYLLENLKESPEVDVRDLMKRFSIDVIGMCAFGFECQTILDVSSIFRRVGLKFSPNFVFMGLRETLAAISPRLVTWFNWTNIHPELMDFFLRVTRDTIKLRNDNPLKRTDFVQLLINAQQEEQKLLAQSGDSESLFTDAVMAGHMFLFFVAGFESSSLILGYCLYELALNPDIMQKLHVEVKRVMEARGGKLDHDVLKEMQYLDCVISETLRKYPSIGWLDRICTKTFEDPNSSLVINENTNILIPVYALHHDPQYFPEPHKFNPDRFSEENKGKIVPGTYLPFGAGPRICVGRSFSLMELRAALAHISRYYTVHPTDKLPVPVTFKQRTLFNVANHGIPLRFQRRAESGVNSKDSATPNGTTSSLHLR